MCYTLGMKHTIQVNEILAGASLNATAKKYGMGPETIRRELIRHPNYAAAKASGVIRQPGLPGRPQKLLDEAATSLAVAEVVAGATTTATAKKYGLPLASLTKMVHIAHPDFSLQHRGKTKEEVLTEKLRKLNIAKAKELSTTH